MVGNFINLKHNWYVEKSFFFVEESISHELQQDATPGNGCVWFSRQCCVHKPPVPSDHRAFSVVNIDKPQSCFCKSNSLVMQSKDSSKGERPWCCRISNTSTKALNKQYPQSLSEYLQVCIQVFKLLLMSYETIIGKTEVSFFNEVFPRGIVYPCLT